MKKIKLIVGREYFTRVKKKSFLITTILVPLVIIAFYAAIIAITIDGDNEKQKVAVLDDAHLFNGKPDTSNKTVVFTFISNETEKSFVKKYKDLGYQSFLYLPSDTSGKSKNKYVLHSQSSVSLSAMSAIEDIINNTIRTKQLISNGIDPKEFDKLTNSVSLDNTIDTKEGEKKSFAGVAYAVSFGCGFLIYMMMMIYGTQVMRGVTEEKTNRIAEVMVSSVKPFQLMMGKILGIGAVGLTQFAIWIILMAGMQLAIPLIFPDMMNHINSGNLNNPEGISMVATALQGLSSLPLTKIILSFLFYFLGGYLTYASIFAAVGSVVSEDQQEAQQLVFPVIMPIILGFVIMTKAVNEPNSSLAVFGSLFPLTSPIVMMGRITYDIPAWQIGLSMILLIGSFLFFTWITGKIYRTGILMYGKKPSWKEMIKWAFAKSNPKK
ncbi:MAG: ABC transporter permease [Bacteroidota bacterium]